MVGWMCACKPQQHACLQVDPSHHVPPPLMPATAAQPPAAHAVPPHSAPELFVSLTPADQLRQAEAHLADLSTSSEHGACICCAHAAWHGEASILMPLRAGRCIPALPTLAPHHSAPRSLPPAGPGPAGGVRHGHQMPVHAALPAAGCEDAAARRQPGAGARRAAGCSAERLQRRHPQQHGGACAGQHAAHAGRGAAGERLGGSGGMRMPCMSIWLHIMLTQCLLCLADATPHPFTHSVVVHVCHFPKTPAPPFVAHCRSAW